MVVDIETVRQVSVYARDMDTMVEFYRDVLGLELMARFEDGVPLAFFSLGATRLMLQQEGTACTIYLGVADIHETVRKLSEAGVKIEGEPHVIYHDSTGFFGTPGRDEWLAFFRDPSDNLIGLSSRQ